ncbi:MAG: IS21 family transposase [Desulfovibrionales bacterium]|nr:IS21 family transposase [Desulfovibrionales bacterium]
MLIVETIAKIRRNYFIEKKGIKQIARDLKISKNTVRKVIREGKTKHEYLRSHQPYPRLGPYFEFLNQELDQDWKRPKKKRYTATRLYERLQSKGYEGSYDSVQRYVRQWRRDKGKVATKTFIPLYFPPGDAYQFDWSHELAVINGEIRQIKVAHFKFCHSRKFFVVAYFRESQEMVMDAHDKAFEFFGGVCNRGIYDNMSTAVTTVLRGKEREYNPRFSQMCSHYLVEPVACTPGAGWEKGQVEKQVRDIRQRLFIPKPRFASLEELNQWLKDQCIQICEKRNHPKFKDKTIQEVFEAEKPFLIPVTAKFDGYTQRECSVSSTCLVNFNRNHYSVPCTNANGTVTLRALADKIIIVKNGEQIACHTRCFQRGKTIYDPWHYLGVLERKPGALRNGAPFQNWKLPSGLKRLQSRLSQSMGGDRQFVNILVAAKLHGMTITNKICQEALAQGITQSDVILNMLAREIEPPQGPTIEIPAHLNLTIEPISDCQRYDRLREGGNTCSVMNS